MSPHEGCRLPLSVRLIPLPVDPIPTTMTCPLRSAGVTPLHCYYEAVRPSPAHRYFRPRVFSACAFSLSITGQVLKFRKRARSESHASYTPDAAWPVSRISAMLFPEQSKDSGFDVIKSLTMLQTEVRLRSSLSPIHDAVKAAPFNHDVHHRGF